jgi:hypothetical protein
VWEPQPVEAAIARAPTHALRALVERVAAELAPMPPAGDDVLAAGAPAAPAATPVQPTDARATGDAARDGEGTRAGRTSEATDAPATAHDVTHSAAAADPAFVVRDLNVLQPGFREKVERVVSRIREEFGHEVIVAETWRGQARQERLYEQGRTRDGEVVTWTRHSRHSEGRAADLVIDGGAGGLEGYRQLAQVAQEEGLQTLGAHDPGHVELARLRLAGGPGASATITEVSVSATPGSSGVVMAAPVAAIAPVASVAPVAAIAPVATVARVGASGRDGRMPDRTARAREASEAPNPSVREPIGDAAYGRGIGSAVGQHIAGVTATEAPRASDAIARAAHVLGLQDARNAQPVSHLMLRLDNPDGGEDRVRIALRGINVGATMEVQDPAAANHFANRLPELAQALEARGLEAGTLRVRAAATADAASLGDIARAAGGGGDAATVRRGTLFAESGSLFSRSRDETPGQRPQHESPRYRSRREQKEDRQ